MASTSVHLSRELVDKLDEVAARRGVSRNRVIVEACEELVAGERGQWPAAFFDNDDRSAAQLTVLAEAGRDLEEAVLSTRRDRTVAPL